jgi:hypothetical protein
MEGGAERLAVEEREGEGEGGLGGSIIGAVQGDAEIGEKISCCDMRD